MEDYVVLDTNLASKLYKTHRLPPHIAEEVGGFRTAVSFATIGEMTMWADYRNWQPEEHKALDRWLATHHQIDGDEDVAKCWGRLTSAARHRGRPVEVNDTWIAASCLIERMPLATLNTKDFLGFASHHGLSLVGAEQAREAG